MSQVEFLTVNQAAEVGQVDRATIYRMIKRGDIVPTKFMAATPIHYSQIGLEKPPLLTSQAQPTSGVNSGVGK
jgi:hypothetical protein